VLCRLDDVKTTNQYVTHVTILAASVGGLTYGLDG
jgi:hypothetical protein